MADLIVFCFVIIVVVAFGVKALWEMFHNPINPNNRRK